MFGVTHSSCHLLESCGNKIRVVPGWVVPSGDWFTKGLVSQLVKLLGLITHQLNRDHECVTYQLRLQLETFGMFIMYWFKTRGICLEFDGLLIVWMHLCVAGLSAIEVLT